MPMGYPQMSMQQAQTGGSNKFRELFGENAPPPPQLQPNGQQGMYPQMPPQMMMGGGKKSKSKKSKGKKQKGAGNQFRALFGENAAPPPQLQTNGQQGMYPQMPMGMGMGPQMPPQMMMGGGKKSKQQKGGNQFRKLFGEMGAPPPQVQTNVPQQTIQMPMGPQMPPQMMMGGGVTNEQYKEKYLKYKSKYADLKKKKKK